MGPDPKDAAHANGNISFNSEDQLARKVRDVLRTVEEIQRHSAPAISEGYKAFLIASQDPEEREYTDDAQQIEEVLVKEFYMSASDIAFCRDCDIAGQAGEPGFAAIQTLHQRLVDLYPPEEEAEAA